MKTIIERGASWTLEETKLLLRLWGKDLVERQASGAKRTKEVYETIAAKFTEQGHERTPDQVRTRIFNMIAEYRRILKEDSREREKKCIFFRALHKIYQARHMEDVEYALDDYDEDYTYSPSSGTVLSGVEDELASENDAADGNETINQSVVVNDSNNLIATNAVDTNNTTSNSKITSNSNNNNNNNAKAGSKDGDSNNNEKESTASASNNQHQQQNLNHGTGASASAKKIKLDPSKPSSHSNQANQSATTSTSLHNSHQDNANTTTKQNKTSPVTLVDLASMPSGGIIAPPSSSSLPTSAIASTSSSTSAQRHQSLLLPHATAATTSSSPASTSSTPISKLMTSGSNNTPSYININSTKLPILRTNPLVGHTNGNEAILNGTANRLPTTAITSHQLYQAPVNTFDVTSSALLIDRMFAHLSRESENMREWIALEKERLSLERTRRQQETEREVRRERVLIDTLMKFQDQWLSFLARLDPRVVENTNEHPPELRIPAREAPSNDTSQTTSNSTATSSQTDTSSKQP